MQILWVDDELKTLKYITLALYEHEVTTVSSYEEAIAHVIQREYDVVVCDYNLGAGKYGTEILDYVAQKFPHTARYIASAYSRDIVGEGNFGYISKPLKWEIIRPQLKEERLYNG